jgi:hypothetical protein
LAWAAGAAWREAARRVPGGAAGIPGRVARRARSRVARRARSRVARRARSPVARRVGFLVLGRVRFLVVRRGRSPAARRARSLAARPPEVRAGRSPAAGPARPTGPGPAAGMPLVPGPGPDRPAAEGNAAGAAWAASPPAARGNSAAAADSGQQTGPGPLWSICRRARRSPSYFIIPGNHPPWSPREPGAGTPAAGAPRPGDDVKRVIDHIAGLA